MHSPVLAQPLLRCYNNLGLSSSWVHGVKHLTIFVLIGTTRIREM